MMVMFYHLSIALFGRAGYAFTYENGELFMVSGVRDRLSVLRVGLIGGRRNVILVLETNAPERHGKFYLIL